MSDQNTLRSTIQSQFRQAAKAVCKPVTETPVYDSCQTKKNNVKSSAQVATSVGQQDVRQKSCGLKPRESRAVRITARFSEDERELLVRQAETVCLTVSEYIRAAVLGADYRPPLSKELCSSLLALHRELTKQGSNLNQIARQLNAGLITPDRAEQLLASLMPELSKAYTAIYETLANGEVQA